VLSAAPTGHPARLDFRGVGTVLIDDFASRIYPSQYHPIERVWGVLEQHWKGAWLDSRQAVLRLASPLTYNRLAPIVKFIDRVYQTGVRLSQQAMAVLETRLQRLPGLGPWFVQIAPRC
jgi:hypothetical protein